MANELRQSSIGGTGASDTDDFVLAAYDESGVLQHTVLRVPVAGYQTCLPSTLTAAGSANLILPGVQNVALGANVNDVNDWVTLPALASVPVGHTVTIVAGVANCEVRTPASSNEKINGQDGDGTKEYLLTATQVHRFTKIDNTIGWMGQGFTAIGAVATAVVPD